MIEFPIHREFGFDHRARSAGGTRHHFRQAVIGLRPQHNIHPGRAGGDFRPFRLGHTARHRNNHLPAARNLGLPQAAKVREHLLGRFFADMAGIEDDHIGILRHFRWRIAKRRQHIRHARAVIDIHLAAPGADQKPLPGRGAGCISHGNKPLTPQDSGAKRGRCAGCPRWSSAARPESANHGAKDHKRSLKSLPAPGQAFTAPHSGKAGSGGGFA